MVPLHQEVKARLICSCGRVDIAECGSVIYFCDHTAMSNGKLGSCWLVDVLPGKSGMQANLFQYFRCRTELPGGSDAGRVENDDFGGIKVSLLARVLILKDSV